MPGALRAITFRTVRSDVARCWAGFALLGAGLIHVAVVREHLAFSPVHGTFFIVVGTAQLLVALVILARDRVPFANLVIASQLGLIAFWAASRTTGVPIGPAAWTPEPVGTADLLSVALQLLAVVAVLAAVVPGRRRVRGRPGRWLLAIGAGALAVAALTTPALASTAAGEHTHHHGGHGAAGH